ncbi:hypothetical protein Tco_0132838, partial [Tanacetum coccineum]
EDEGLGLEEEEAVPEGQQQAVPVVKTAASEPLGLGYEALRLLELAVGEDQVPSTYEVVQSSRSMPEQQEDDRVYTNIPIYPPVAPVQTPLSPEWSSATISVDEDQFLKVGAQLELHGSILQDHTQRLDALPPTMIADIDRDVRELYTRSEVVRDEIFSRPLEIQEMRGRVTVLEQESDCKE